MPEDHSKTLMPLQSNCITDNQAEALAWGDEKAVDELHQAWEATSPY